MSRKLSELLASLIGARLPAPITKASNPNLVTLMAMSALEGTREKTGSNDGALVDSINATTGSPAGSSYCMNTFQSAVRYAENVMGLVSPLFNSGNSQEVFKNSPKKCQILLKDIRPGDALVYQHGTGSAGHTAVVVMPEVANGFTFTIEGNTTAGSGSSAEGVFYRMRSLSTAGQEMHLLGAVRPFPDSPIA